MPEDSKVRWWVRLWRWIFGKRPHTVDPEPRNLPVLSPDYELVPDQHWAADTKFPVDPRLRVVLAQIEAGNKQQIKERAGIDLDARRRRPQSTARVRAAQRGAEPGVRKSLEQLHGAAHRRSVRERRRRADVPCPAPGRHAWSRHRRRHAANERPHHDRRQARRAARARDAYDRVPR